MSQYGSTDEIKRKIREGMYRTFVKESTNELWKYFVGISSVDGDANAPVALPFVSCVKCSSVLTYNSKTGGTSHLRRHADGCQSKAGASSSSPGIVLWISPGVISNLSGTRPSCPTWPNCLDIP